MTGVKYMALSILLLGFAPAHAAVCFSVEPAHLKHKYQEAPEWSGLDAAGRLVKLYTSPNGTWTLTFTMPGRKVECIIAGGTDSQALPVLRGTPS